MITTVVTNKGISQAIQVGLDETGSNKLYIENTDATPTGALIYGEFDNDMLRINGALELNGGLAIQEDEWIGISPTAERLVFDGSDGNIEIMDAKLGIGNSDPQFQTDIASSGSGTGLRVKANTTAAGSISKINFAVTTSNPANETYSSFIGGMRTSTSQELVFGTASTAGGTPVEKMRLDGSGQLGIGVTNPATMLEVNGDITLNEDDWIGIGSANERIVFDGSGNEIEIIGAEVGITTTAPEYNLHVNASTAEPIALFRNTGSYDGFIALQANGGTGFTTRWDLVSKTDGGFGIYDKDPNTLRFIIDNDGDVGIGTSSPGTKLHVYGTSPAIIRITPSSTNSNSEIQLSENTTYSYGGYIRFNGSSNQMEFGGMNSTETGPHLIIGRNNGEITMPGVYTDQISGTYLDLYIKDDGQLGYISSSKRYKDNIVDMEEINWLFKLRPVNFTYKSDESDSKEYGLIAEEVEEVNSELVTYNKEGLVETVSYSKLVTPLLKAVQDQQKQLVAQQKEIDLLKQEIEALKGN